MKASASEVKTEKIQQSGFYSPLCLGFLEPLVLKRLVMSHIPTGISVSFHANMFSSHMVYSMIDVKTGL